MKWNIRGGIIGLVVALAGWASVAPAQTLAWYAGADDRPAEQSFADVGSLARSANHAAVISATVGKGRVVLFGNEVAWRAQPHGTFKLLFNGVYSGSASNAGAAGRTTDQP